MCTLPCIDSDRNVPYVDLGKGFGRYDTNSKSHNERNKQCSHTDTVAQGHPIADAHPDNLDAIIFPGQDYNNARVYDFEEVNKWENNKRMTRSISNDRKKILTTHSGSNQELEDGLVRYQHQSLGPYRQQSLNSLHRAVSHTCLLVQKMRARLTPRLTAGTTSTARNTSIGRTKATPLWTPLQPTHPLRRASSLVTMRCSVIFISTSADTCIGSLGEMMEGKIARNLETRARMSSSVAGAPAEPKHL